MNRLRVIPGGRGAESDPSADKRNEAGDPCLRVLPQSPAGKVVWIRPVTWLPDPPGGGEAA